ncbi:hypothetical protein K469DRAFT_686126 [Zopfia rhizophila CBS 207.26]|uniref:Uncharacterized protein n=1 Tax=Zopfia rhizophila CBS 207.26 TaxID=1314779 RepID=A0A6A6E7Z4_9PEZI|nr:hypothetical protein K469DRAFT_686126 [Zopfia rhizophila CBS 207.26]
MDKQTADFFKLSQENALSALLPLEEWLPKAEYQQIGDLGLCSDQKLVELSKELLEYLSEDVKDFFTSNQHETRITAIHFHKPGSSVPVKEGSNVLLVPIVIKDGAKIADRGLEKLDYVRLSEQAAAEPEFYALLLLRDDNTIHSV